MKAIRNAVRHLSLTSFVFVLILFHAPKVFGHCDALDGPVVKDARKALVQHDVSLVLMWVSAEDEPEVRSAFEQTLRVRELGQEARALADRYFFETVVRLHRASEGEPFTGLKPAGQDPGPAVRAADEALEQGKADELIQLITTDVEHGLHKRFDLARATLARAGENVGAGREYVAAYVDFVHYAKRLFEDATSNAVHGEAESHIIH